LIRKLLVLKNAGILEDATSNGPVLFDPVTIVYAENGLGKTTLASVLRAWRHGEAGRLQARKTIGSASEPEVDILLADGQHARFSGGAWSGPSPLMVIFDPEFVESNVFSGSEVRADQRQSLLNFALGEDAVRSKELVERLTDDIAGQTSRLSQSEKVLRAVAHPFAISNFVALKPAPDLEDQVERLRKRIADANAAPQLIARQDAAPLSQITFDVSSAASTLNRTLGDLEATALATVTAHLQRHSLPGFENWLSDGPGYVTADECPFCGQGTSGIVLIAAYRSYFTEEYASLQRDLRALRSLVISELADTRVDALVSDANTNAARVSAWRDQLDVSAPDLEADDVRSAIRLAREGLEGLVEDKLSSPLTAVAERAEIESIQTAISAAGECVTAYNQRLAAVQASIVARKAEASAADVSALRMELERLEAACRRQQAEVDAAAKEYTEATAQKKDLEGKKAAARKLIDEQMAALLKAYQGTINTLLRDFGADFTIDALGPTYIGSGEPRADYQLFIRNKPVPLGCRQGGPPAPSFGTVLSESDKRALALAFFIARLKADPQVQSKTIVVDDPVCSFDMGRKRMTIRRLAELAAICEQLVILSHDAFFVRDMRDFLGSPEGGLLAPRLVALKRKGIGAAFGDCDIDEICAGKYRNSYRLVADFVAGANQAKPAEVAPAIRVMLEGYYQRKFPGRIPPPGMLGNIIGLARGATPPDALAYLQPSLQELGEINDYARDFHHDDGTDQPDSEQELLAFARKALDLVHRAGAS